MVRDTCFQRKGKSPKEKETQRFFLGRCRKCSVLSHYVECYRQIKMIMKPWILCVFMAFYTMCRHLIEKERGKENESKHDKTHGSNDGCCISCYVLPNVGICCRRNCRICAINVCYFLGVGSSVRSDYSCTYYKRSV